MIGVGIEPVAAFGAASIITFTAGLEVLGYAEAARIAAVPIIVIGVGLGLCDGPPGHEGCHSAMTERCPGTTITGSTPSWSRLRPSMRSAVGFDWVGNPMAFAGP